MNKPREDILAEMMERLYETGDEGDLQDLETELDHLSDSELADLLGAGHCLNLLEQIHEFPDETTQTIPKLKDQETSQYRWDETPGDSNHRYSHSESLSAIGRFQIFELAARGGFAEIYHAYDPSLERDVAIKIPTKKLGEDSAARLRFEREARAVATMAHPAIVPVYEFGVVDDKFFIALEWVPGQNLREYLESCESSIPANEAAAAIARISQAVSHAHQRGILHRDLKPANVLLDEKLSDLPWFERVRVTDFGLAKHVDQQAAKQDLTAEGSLLGTPAYMSPEQVRAEKLGPTTDVFALGTILYEMLTGSPPSKRDSYVSTIRAIENEAARPIRVLRANVPRDLEVICHKCLEKDPERRYPDTLELVADLERFLNGMPIRARRPNTIEVFSKWVRRNTVLATSLALTILTLIVATFATTLALNKSKETAANLKDQLTVMKSIFEDLDERSGVVLEQADLRDQLSQRLIDSSDQIVALSTGDAMQSELIATFGKALVSIGSPAEAERIIENAIELARKNEAPLEDIWRLQIQLSLSKARQYQHDDALEILDAIIDAVVASPKIENKDKAQAIVNRAISAHHSRHHVKRAAKLYSAALESIEKLELEKGAKARLLGMVQQRIAVLDFNLKPSPEKLELLVSRFESLKENYDLGHPHLTLASHDLVRALSDAKQFDRAIKLAEKTFQESRGRYGVTSVNTLMAAGSVIVALTRGNKVNGAKLRLRRVLPVTEANWLIAAQRVGKTHPYLVSIRYSIARGQMALGRRARQLDTLGSLVDDLEASHGREQRETQIAIMNLGLAMKNDQRLEDAIELFSEVVATSEKAEHPISRKNIRYVKKQLMMAKLMNAAAAEMETESVETDITDTSTD